MCLVQDDYQSFYKKQYNSNSELLRFFKNLTDVVYPFMPKNQQSLYGTNDYTDAIFSLDFNQTTDELPMKLNENQLDLIPMSTEALMDFIIYENDMQIKLMSSTFLNLISENFNERIKAFKSDLNFPLKYIYISGHDTTLVGYMKSILANDEIYLNLPAYAS